MHAGHRGILGELFGHGRGSVLVFCWLGWVFDFFDLFLFSLLNRTIAGDLGLDQNIDIGWIDGWVMLATAAGGFGLGWVADRRGRRAAMVYSILIYSAGTVATGFAEGFWSLLAARVVTAIGVGGEWGIGHALVAETYPLHLRGRAAGLLQAGTPFAIVLAAVWGSFVGPHIGWQWCFWLAGLPAILVFFARRAVPDDRDEVVRAPGALRELVAGDQRHRSIWLLILVTVHLAAFWSSYSWMPRILAGRGWQPQEIGWYQITVALLQMAGNISFGFVADRFGQRRAFAGYCTVFTAGLLWIIFHLDTLATDRVAMTAAMSCTALGLGTWSAFGPLFAANYPERLRAMASSGIYNLGRSAQLGLQPLAGVIRHGGSDSGVLLLGAGMGVLSAVLIYFVPRGLPTVPPTAPPSPQPPRA
jgi:MFS family permease